MRTMRRAATLLCLALTLGIGVSSRSGENPRERERERTVEKKKPAPEAAQGRRRAVRKTTAVGPQARPDTYQVARGATLQILDSAGVLKNDTDPQSKPLTAILVSTPAHGMLTFNANGSFSYVNDGSAATTDSFTYKASNGTVETNTATVTLNIIDLPPQAVNDTYAASQDTPVIIEPPGLLTNDTRNQAAIASYGVNGTEQTTIGTSTPTSQGGSAAVNTAGGFTYTPPNGFTGSDSFRYVITNSGGSSNAQVSISVLPPAPIAVPDQYATLQGSVLDIEAPGVLGNDTLNGGTLIAYGASSGDEQTNIGANTPTSASGVVRINADGSFRYDPNDSFTGNDTFTYTIGNAGGTTTATVTIAVQASNAVDFTVTSPGFFYQFSGVPGNNPVLTLQRGRTYRFRITTSSAHPFEILDAPEGSVTNNNISNGILIFAVPPGPGTYTYHCSLHEFGNSINTTP